MRSASLLEFFAARSGVHLLTFEDGARRGETSGAETSGAETSGAETSGTEISGSGKNRVARTSKILLPRHRRDWASRCLRNTRRLLSGTLLLTDRFCSAACRSRVESAIGGERYAISVVEHFWCAPYLSLLRPLSGQVILDLHNVESILHERCALSEPWPQSMAHRLFAQSARRAEERLLGGFDLILVPSGDDARIVRNRAPEANVRVFPNALPSMVQPSPPEEHVIAFSGNFEYHPNVTAVRHFSRKIWPLLRRADPGLRWRLIGKNERSVRKFVSAGDRIECTGRVDNALEELARAKVVVVPLLAGSGTRIKILEAWAAGRAVVSTKIGAEGLPAVDGENIRIVDDPATTVKVILDLLSDERQRRRLGEAGRRTYEQSGCWSAAWKELSALMGTPFSVRPFAKTI